MKSYTDLEQSKKLAEILPLESADMCYINGDSGKIIIGEWGNNVHDEDDIPCWSLAALLGVLPDFIGDYGKCLYYDVGGYYCGYMVDGDFMLTIEETNADNQIDACYEMILKLHEQKLL